MKKWMFLIFNITGIAISFGQPWIPMLTDTLPPREVNGLKVLPIRYTKLNEVRWELKAANFEEHLKKMKNRHAGYIANASQETEEAIYEWMDDIWYQIVPKEIREIKDLWFDIGLYINKEGRIFAADFFMNQQTFQQLNALPSNTLNSFYEKLLCEQCKAIKKATIEPYDINDEDNRDFLIKYCGSVGKGKEYVRLKLSSGAYIVLGTSNKYKAMRIMEQPMEGKVLPIPYERKKYCQ